MFKTRQFPDSKEQRDRILDGKP